MKPQPNLDDLGLRPGQSLELLKRLVEPTIPD